MSFYSLIWDSNYEVRDQGRDKEDDLSIPLYGILSSISSSTSYGSLNIFLFPYMGFKYVDARIPLLPTGKWAFLFPYMGFTFNFFIISEGEGPTLTPFYSLIWDWYYCYGRGCPPR